MLNIANIVSSTASRLRVTSAFGRKSVRVRRKHIATTTFGYMDLTFFMSLISTTRRRVGLTRTIFMSNYFPKATPVIGTVVTFQKRVIFRGIKKKLF